MGVKFNPCVCLSNEMPTDNQLLIVACTHHDNMGARVLGTSPKESSEQYRPCNRALNVVIESILVQQHSMLYRKVNIVHLINEQYRPCDISLNDLSGKQHPHCCTFIRGPR